jgi:hypothetical protein
METDTTLNTLPDESQLNSAEVKSADGDAIHLAKLNEFLGKDFKDVDTALKSVKDTFSYVGKQDSVRQAVKQVMEKTGKDETAVLSAFEKIMSENNAPQGDFITKEQYAEDMFFGAKPELSVVKDIIKPLKTSSDEFKAMSWGDFVKNDKIASIVDTFKVAEDYRSSKSVVESNPRIGSATTKLQSAREAQANGDTSVAKANAVDAVMDLLQ